MAKYKVIILGTLEAPKEQKYMVESDHIGLRDESIVFADTGKDPKLIIPKNCSIVIDTDQPGVTVI